MKDKHEELISLMTENLPVFRAKLAWTQEKLAQEIGINRTSLIAMEKGKRKMAWGHFLSFYLIFSKDCGTLTLLKAFGIQDKYAKLSD